MLRSRAAHVVVLSCLLAAMLPSGCSTLGFSELTSCDDPGVSCAPGAGGTGGAGGGSCVAPMAACDGSCVDLDSDAAHCGACNVSCFDQACDNGSCAGPDLVWGGELFNACHSVAVTADGSHAFVTRWGTPSPTTANPAGGLFRIDLATKESMRLSTHHGCAGIAIAGDSVYYGCRGDNNDDEGVYQIAIASDTETRLPETVGQEPFGFAATATHVYWADSAGGQVWRAAADTTSGEQLSTGNVSAGKARYPFPFDDRVYFTDDDPDRILSAPLTGGDTAIELTPDLAFDSVNGLTVVPAPGDLPRLVYTARGEARSALSNQNGGWVDAGFFAGSMDDMPGEIIAVGEDIFFAMRDEFNMTGGAVYRYRFDFVGPAEVVTSPNGPNGLAYQNGVLYICSRDGLLRLSYPLD